MSESVALVHQAIDAGYSNKKKRAAALELLNKAVELDANNAQAFFERGMVHLEGGKREAALSDFTSALQLDNNYPGAHQWRANVFAEMGEHGKAAQDRLIDLRRNVEPHRGMGVSPQKWADLAESFMKAGQTDNAIESLEEYFKDHADKVTSYIMYEPAPLRVLARALLGVGQCERAVQFARLAYESIHRCPADVLGYALALEATGDMAGAMRLADEAIAINDQWGEAIQLKARLA